MVNVVRHVFSRPANLSYRDLLLTPSVVLILFTCWYFRLWIVPRYFLMVAPICMVVAATFIGAWRRKHSKLAVGLVASVALLALACNAVNLIYHVQDNRRLASAYITNSGISGTITSHGKQYRPTITYRSKPGESKLLVAKARPDYIVVCSPNFPALVKSLRTPFLKPTGPGYAKKTYIQYPRDVQRYNLLVNALIEKRDYSVIKKFEQDRGWVRTVMVAPLWEPEIRIYERTPASAARRYNPTLLPGQSLSGVGFSLNPFGRIQPAL